MKATVTKAFRGVPSGQVYPKRFKVGDELEGDLARKMIEAGFASKSVPEAPRNAALEAAPENRFRFAGMDGSDSPVDSVRTEPKRKRGRPRKNVS